MKSNIVEFPERKSRYVTVDIIDLMPAFCFQNPDGTPNNYSVMSRAALKKVVRGIPQSGAEVIDIKEA